MPAASWLDVDASLSGPGQRDISGGVVVWNRLNAWIEPCVGAQLVPKFAWLRGSEHLGFGKSMAGATDMRQHWMVEMQKMNADNLAKVMKRKNDALTELVCSSRGTSAIGHMRHWPSRRVQRRRGQVHGVEGEVDGLFAHLHAAV